MYFLAKNLSVPMVLVVSIWRYTSIQLNIHLCYINRKNHKIKYLEFECINNTIDSRKLLDFEYFPHWNNTTFPGEFIFSNFF